MKTNCKECGHFKDNHMWGETTDNADKIGHCLHTDCLCDSYFSPDITHNKMPKDTVEELAQDVAVRLVNKDGVPFEVIKEALTTAYKKGVEVGKLGIEYKENELHIKPNSYIEKIFITKENGQTYQITLPEVSL